MICWAFKKPKALANGRQYNFVVDKVMHKLSGWKAKFLSYAGRAVLIQSVMSAIPNHIMQGVALPIFVINLIKLIGISSGDPRMRIGSCILWVGVKL